MTRRTTPPLENAKPSAVWCRARLSRCRPAVGHRIQRVRGNHDAAPRLVTGHCASQQSQGESRAAVAAQPVELVRAGTTGGDDRTALGSGARLVELREDDAAHDDPLAGDEYQQRGDHCDDEGGDLDVFRSGRVQVIEPNHQRPHVGVLAHGQRE